MTGKQQFEGVTTPRTFYDRKVRQVGGTAYVALGRIIPKTWKYVRIHKEVEAQNKIVVSFTKLYEESNNAQATQIHKRGQSDTQKTRTASRRKPISSKK